MQTPLGKMWTFFFAYLKFLDVWLKEVELDYRKSVTFITFVQ